MNSNAKFIFAFVAGAGVGALVTWRIVKTKYEQIMDEEAESFREALAKRGISDEPAEVENTEAPTIPLKRPLEEYKEVVQQYQNMYDNEKKGGSESITNNSKPRVIAPSVFGEDEDYDQISLYYFEDGVLTSIDDTSDIIDDVENTVGKESLNTFGEYEDDAVYVQNDERKCYYEILKDFRKYSEINPDAFPDPELNE